MLQQLLSLSWNCRVRASTLPPSLACSLVRNEPSCRRTLAEGLARPTDGRSSSVRNASPRDSLGGGGQGAPNWDVLACLPGRPARRVPEERTAKIARWDDG